MNPFNRKSSSSRKKPRVEDYIDMDSIDADRKPTKESLGKIAALAMRAGSEVIEKALYLYYAASNPKTPKWARRVIYGALAYLILPVDAIPDFLPAVGYTDDLGVITAALATVAFYITPDVKTRAKATKEKWFSKFKR